MTEKELLKHLQSDKADGMEVLLTQYGPLLRYVIRGVLQDTQDAEDCYSEVSLLLWQRLTDYDAEKGPLSPWLTAIARNTALNHLKARRRREARLAERETEPTSPDTPEQMLLKKERQQRLKELLAGLSEKDKQLFYRKYYYLQSTAQIAAELGLTERAVEGRLYRLRQFLSRELGGDSL